MSDADKEAKGRVCSGQRPEIHRLDNGKDGLQMTDTGRNARGQYASQNLATADDAFLIYASARANEVCRAGKGGHGILSGQGGSRMTGNLPDEKKGAFRRALTCSG